MQHPENTTFGTFTSDEPSNGWNLHLFTQELSSKCLRIKALYSLTIVGFYLEADVSISSRCRPTTTSAAAPRPCLSAASRTRGRFLVDDLEVRPTSRFSHKSQSAELLMTDWPRGAATEIHAIVDVFGRAPRPIPSVYREPDRPVCTYLYLGGRRGLPGQE